MLVALLLLRSCHSLTKPDYFDRLERAWRVDATEGAERARYAARALRAEATVEPVRYAQWTKSLRLDLATTLVAGVGACSTIFNDVGSLSWDVGVATGAADFVLGGVLRSRAMQAEARAWTDIVVGDDARGETALFFLALFCVGPTFAEELLFRGPLLAVSLSGISASAWVALSSAVFGTAHYYDNAHCERTGFHNRLRFLYAAKSGALYGSLAVVSQSLWSSIVAHAVHNLLVCISVRRPLLMGES
ncbi:hypothetical protein CTAYLR_003935 [Chrysophaeum taylorii]|uniref:CAAX prenyl protease 2/Lysostaphin resistance protein A-like domain-containing protein n=1 Tax=Chrysophaeum taylorii TaxID=2483200 RepID=A0AAD7UA93_9STRA|nr:hypothetical protein CTAYLR_003935 [Chrysophaeum taylorii]